MHAKNRITPKSPAIEATNIYKSFNGVTAVQGVNLSIDMGQFTAILGPNGAGKTTLVEMIEGIQRPDRGEIRIMGKSWQGNADEIHRAIGISLQETRFIDKLNVWETLRLFASFYELNAARVDEMIELVGLREKKKALTVSLSGGQRQRLALGIALLNKPKILLLDEPTTGLDPNARREIWSILLDLKKQSRTSLVLTTHYMDEAEQLCDFILIMNKGEVLKKGNIKELLENETGTKFMEFSIEAGSLPKMNSLVKQSPFPIKWDALHNKGRLQLSDFESQLPRFLSFLQTNHIRLNNLECRRQTLDDLFIALTGRRLNE